MVWLISLFSFDLGGLTDPNFSLTSQLTRFTTSGVLPLFAYSLTLHSESVIRVGVKMSFLRLFATLPLFVVMSGCNFFRSDVNRYEVSVMYLPRYANLNAPKNNRSVFTVS
jgi:hypothetical protein